MGRTALGCWLGLGLVACGGGAGDDGTEILTPFDSLSGGVVFASSAFIGSNGYDLYWAPVPQFATLQAQPVLRLTETDGNEWQPSVSANGRAIAFARQDEGIFLIAETGRIKQISDVTDTPYKDSLPAVSPDGTKVAWVREDTTKPVGETGFFETVIMLANYDGSDAKALLPKVNVVQDSPRFDPKMDSHRIAWTEFNAATVLETGPQTYGVWLHDYQLGTGDHLCQGNAVVGQASWRCFGQHLAWPLDNAVVLTQSFLELYIDRSPATSSYETLMTTLTGQNLGVPELDGPAGFFGAFPLSASYLGSSRMILDGVVTASDGDLPGLAFYVAEVDGTELWRLNLADYYADYDPQNTAGYLFSVATPQLIP